jgi:hypothetical protein
MAAIRDFFFSQSKGVSQLEDAFANRFRAIDVFFFHGEIVTFSQTEVYLRVAVDQLNRKRPL